MDGLNTYTFGPSTPPVVEGATVDDEVEPAADADAVLVVLVVVADAAGASAGVTAMPTAPAIAASSRIPRFTDLCLTVRSAFPALRSAIGEK
jgi:hypothetical protein